MKEKEIQKGVFIMAYTIGVIVGIIVTIAATILLVTLFLKLGNKDKRMKTEYDERQKIVIGEGYKIAYWTLAALLVLVQMYKTLAGSFGTDYLAKTDFGVIVFGMIILSIMVFCVYCIFKGAYWGMNNNKKSYVIIIGGIGILNLIISVASIIRGDFVVDGVISGTAVNLMCAILMIVVLAAAGIKETIDKKNDSDEEGDE